nr:PREDICTED: uncharacterized protein LOC109034661 [Bemisia tabaci]
MSHHIISLLIFDLILQHTTDAFHRRRSHGRKFMKGKGATLEVQPGDTLVSSLIVHKKTKNIPIHPPYRWYYAINKDDLLFFTYAHEKKDGKRQLKFKPKLIKRNEAPYADVNFKNRGQKAPHAGLIGSLVGVLMTTTELPFNLLFCNSKHYVEYLSRGAGEGKWYKPYWNRTSKDCPVHNPLKNDADAFWTLYWFKEFELKDKENNTIKLSIPEWPHKIIPLPPMP